MRQGPNPAMTGEGQGFRRLAIAHPAGLPDDGGMKISGRSMRTIWAGADGRSVTIIDQTKLPHVFATCELRSLDEAAHAIRAMLVRGAPLIGATAAYGLALALRDDASDDGAAHACRVLAATRPTAINLRWALDRLSSALLALPPGERAAVAWRMAGELAEEDVAINEAIGEAGLAAIRRIAARKQGRLNILTHCNAGWLATVDWGTALSPVYKAKAAGLDLHVFVDETRPRNQGASLTTWELMQEGVPHTLIADNAGGHLMQRGEIDLCIVGADRVTADASVCNKIGTYLKALAAFDNGVPFHVALPSSTIDFGTARGAEIPIEHRGAREVTHLAGATEQGEVVEIRLAPEGTAALNPAFDVTPPRFVTSFFTERGEIAAAPEALAAAFRV